MRVVKAEVVTCETFATVAAQDWHLFGMFVHVMTENQTTALLRERTHLALKHRHARFRKLKKIISIITNLDQMFKIVVYFVAEGRFFFCHLVRPRQ